MIGKFLRQISREQLKWSQYAREWQQQGATVVQNASPLQPALLAVRADSGWEALLDLDIWFASMMSAHAGLAASAFDRTQRERLFFGCERPLELGLEMFDYTILSPVEPVKVPQCRQLYYGLKTAHCTVWVATFGDENKKPSFSHQKISLDYLPMPLHFEIGSSECRLSVINKLCCGDVLLITKPEQRVTLHGKCLGSYQRTDNEIVMEDDFLQTPLADDEERIQDDERASILPRSQMPVKLTFTLQKTVLTVQDLESLSQGYVFLCDPEAERKVIISGNGLALAQGELIWIEDRLGVEITRLYHEVDEGK